MSSSTIKGIAHTSHSWMEVTIVALTEVWWRGSDGEWTRTSATEADAQFSYSVSAGASMFRCYKCFQYVTFVKSKDRFVSHFRHNRGETSKECEDRSGSVGSSMINGFPLTDFMLRLKMDGLNARISLGIPPAKREAIRAMSNNGTVMQISGMATRAVYKVDCSRFIPDTVNWFDISFDMLRSFSITFQPIQCIPTHWKLRAPKIPHYGTLFDSQSGRMVIEMGDVEVGKEYYLLRLRYNSLYTYSCDISYQQIWHDDHWAVYRIKAMKMSNAASEFFFDEMHMRLTQHPSDIDVLWPPCVQRGDVIDTDQKQITIYVRGDQDLQTYPRTGNYATLLNRLSPTHKVYKVDSYGSLQMICAERFSQALQCLYLRPPEKIKTAPPQMITVMDDEGTPLDDFEIKKLPSRGILRFLSVVDGSVDVFDREDFCYRKILPAGVEVRITDIKNAMTIVLRQATKIVCRITTPSPIPKKLSSNTAELWHGKMISFPARYAGILLKMRTDSNLYINVRKALLRGTIPEDGLRVIQKLLEEQSK